MEKPLGDEDGEAVLIAHQHLVLRGAHLVRLRARARVRVRLRLRLRVRVRARARARARARVKARARIRVRVRVWVRVRVRLRGAHAEHPEPVVRRQTDHAVRPGEVGVRARSGLRCGGKVTAAAAAPPVPSIWPRHGPPSWCESPGWG
eukprot:scaffold90407_cov55-Phaeocystis_antarctica.AAC.1